MNLKLIKYTALGNEYLVVDESNESRLTPEQVRVYCSSKSGPGADGMLEGKLGLPCPQVTIWNADGSRGEKSGNGLRIFARYLWDQKQVGEQPFSIVTDGGEVTAQVFDQGQQVRVAMGQVVFKDSFVEPEFAFGDGEHRLEGTIVSVGNPHCVFLTPDPNPRLAKRVGPLVEHDPHFPHRTNVQFVDVISPSQIRMEVWERGSGYTLSSGTGAIAAAAVCRRRGDVEANVSVLMAGGTLLVTLDEHYAASIEGPVECVAEFRL